MKVEGGNYKNAIRETCVHLSSKMAQLHVFLCIKNKFIHLDENWKRKSTKYLANAVVVTFVVIVNVGK